MKKILFLVITSGLLLSACLPASLQQPDATSPSSFSEADLQSTMSAAVQQTLQSLPTATTAPSETPVIIAATRTSIPSETPTASETPATVTGMAALSGEGTGTVTNTPTSGTTAAEKTSTPTGTILSPTNTATATVTFTPALLVVSTITETPHPQFYGTLPPNLPSSGIKLINKSKAEVYISLQGTTTDGFTTILEYPVKGSLKIKAPTGSYVYVAWVGGKQLVGSFHLGNQSDVVITIYKDKIQIKAQQ